MIQKADLALLTERLDHVLSLLYDCGFRRFFSGAALGMDLLAAERVLALRETHTGVHLAMVIPCAHQTHGWPAMEKARHSALIARADESPVLAEHYYPGCMMVRNRYMVDRSRVCVCWLTHSKGGTMSTAAYASSKGISLLNLAIDSEYHGFLSEPEIWLQGNLPF